MAGELKSCINPLWGEEVGLAENVFELLTLVMSFFRRSVILSDLIRIDSDF